MHLILAYFESRLFTALGTCVWVYVSWAVDPTKHRAALKTLFAFMILVRSTVHVTRSHSSGVRTQKRRMPGDCMNDCIAAESYVCIGAPWWHTAHVRIFYLNITMERRYGSAMKKTTPNKFTLVGRWICARALWPASGHTLILCAATTILAAIQTTFRKTLFTLTHIVAA